MNGEVVGDAMAGLSARARELLRGAIDMHVHASPDPFAERLMDARTLVRAARDAGMAGLVLKSHEYGTQPLAWALDEECEGVRVYGAIALDHGVGGLNPDALEVALRIGTKVVWWPTFDAAWSRARFRRWNSRAGAITVLDEDGELVPVCHELLDLVQAHDAVLCSGHLSPEETLALVGEARRRGIRSVVTHATSFGIPTEVQVALAGQGAFIEQCAPGALGPDGDARFRAIRADVEAVGAGSVVLSTDLGQATSVAPPVGFGLWIERFLEAGVPAPDVRRMVQGNPAALLA